MINPLSRQKNHFHMSNREALKKGTAFFQWQCPEHFAIVQDEFLQGECYGGGGAQEKERSSCVTQAMALELWPKRCDMGCLRGTGQEAVHPLLSQARLVWAEPNFTFLSHWFCCCNKMTTHPTSQREAENQAKTKVFYLISTFLFYKLICK